MLILLRVANIRWKVPVFSNFVGLTLFEFTQKEWQLFLVIPKPNNIPIAPRSCHFSFILFLLPFFAQVVLPGDQGLLITPRSRIVWWTTRSHLHQLLGNARWIPVSFAHNIALEAISRTCKPLSFKSLTPSDWACFIVRSSESRTIDRTITLDRQGMPEVSKTLDCLTKTPKTRIWSNGRFWAWLIEYQEAVGGSCAFSMELLCRNGTTCSCLGRAEVCSMAAVAANAANGLRRLLSSGKVVIITCQNVLLNPEYRILGLPGNGYPAWPTCQGPYPRV